MSLISSTNTLVGHNLNNHLLALLADADYERLRPYLKEVHLPLGLVLHESGTQLQYVYFPTTAIVSISYIMKDGATGGVAAVGNDGMLGVSLFMGTDTTSSRAVVQSEGYALCLASQILKKEFQRAGSLQNLLLRYTQTLLTQTTQSCVCSRHHLLSQQLCKWLLISMDRLSSNEIKTTQSLIANMLGVRREGITEAAGDLQKAGLIRCRRGLITVLDPIALKQHACECYAHIKKEYERLLPALTKNQHRRFLIHNATALA